MNNSPGKIITFYSYKGGTGRSMVLANVAWILASNGKKVLAVDWDLEAPGLHRYFYPFLLDKDLTASEGIIDFVSDYSMAAMTPSPDKPLEEDWYVPYADILRYAISLDWKFPGAGRLDLIPAGRQGDSYSTRVNSLDWQDFYGRLGGWTFLEAAKAKMKSEYDFILIDSRTGVSDTSGICTVQMPDALVVCYLLNNQSIDGSAAVATSVYEQRKSAGIDIFPVPMRVENAEKVKRDARKEYGKDRFAAFTELIVAAEREQYRAKVQFPYVPYYAYEEILATFGDKPEDTNTLLESAERLTSYLTEGTVTTLTVSAEAIRRDEVLSAYAQATRSTAPSKDQTDKTRSLFHPGLLAGKAWKILQRSTPLWMAVICLLLALGTLVFGVKAGRRVITYQRDRDNAITASKEAQKDLDAAGHELDETKRQLAIATEAPESSYKLIKDLQQSLKDQTQVANDQTRLAQKSRADADNQRKLSMVCAAEAKKAQLDNSTLRLSLAACRRSGGVP